MIIRPSRQTRDICFEYFVISIIIIIINAVKCNLMELTTKNISIL